LIFEPFVKAGRTQLNDPANQGALTRGGLICTFAGASTNLATAPVAGVARRQCVTFAGEPLIDLSIETLEQAPATGEVMLFDNDNVKPNDATAVHQTTGSPRFQAPEIVRGHSPPTKESDRFGLSVLLFWFLTRLPSPFEGNILDEISGWDEERITRDVYGKPAPFVFHPTDRMRDLNRMLIRFSPADRCRLHKGFHEPNADRTPSDHRPSRPERHRRRRVLGWRGDGRGVVGNDERNALRPEVVSS
jgi:serine/threonine protein kinase